MRKEKEMQFCEKIIRLRKSKRMSQEALAEAVGVSRQAVYKWECGQSYPEAMKLVALKELFGISVDDLLDENFEVAYPVRQISRRAPKAAQENAEAAPAQAVANAQIINQTPAENEKIADKAEEIPTPAPQAAEEAPKKKGFFARLFGR